MRDYMAKESSKHPGYLAPECLVISTESHSVILVSIEEGKKDIEDTWDS